MIKLHYYFKMTGGDSVSSEVVSSAAAGGELIAAAVALPVAVAFRSEERRVGKECL